MNRMGSIFMAVFLAVFIPPPGPSRGRAAENKAPIADAGLTRYAAVDPVRLDGSRSYDPDESGTLSYTWRQTRGPVVVIQDPDMAQPVISGPARIKYGQTIETLLQTDQIQVCEFELVVSDGVAESRPDRVQMVIVPDFGDSVLELANLVFDPAKPTVIHFGGGDCTFGYPGPGVTDAVALAKYNAINFPQGFRPDREGFRSYLQLGDMVIVYLSAVAPGYAEAIQTEGFSTGGQAAVDAARRLNLTYKDARFTVNRVVLFDAASHCRDYSDSIAALIAGSVDGERCWVQNLVCTAGDFPSFHPGVLNVELEFENHLFPSWWYLRSDIVPDSPMNEFNGGLVAGAFVGVSGPARTLQLAFTPESHVYWFQWRGSLFDGHMEMKDASRFPGRLPEPVMLLGPPDGATVGPDGAVLACEPSENAVGYQLLFGADPGHMVYLYSETAAPPNEVVTAFPCEQTWWTVLAYDAFGTTICADPRLINAAIVKPQPIENAATGQRYPSVQAAVNDALSDDEILVSPGMPYLETIDFRGKSVTLRSANPALPAIVGADIISAGF